MFTVTVENSWLVQFMGSEFHSRLLPFSFLRDVATKFAIHVNPRRWNGESWKLSDPVVGTAVCFGRFAWVGAKIQSALMTDFFRWVFSSLAGRHVGVVMLSPGRESTGSLGSA